MNTPSSVSYLFEDRQWDLRINVPTSEYLEDIVANVCELWKTGKMKYVLIGGVEIGTKPTQTDFQVKHVHAAVIYYNKVSKNSILKSWGILEGNGYYMVPRNRSYPYSGWRDHHTKEHTKVNAEETLILEYGVLPKDIVATKRKNEDVVYRSEVEKKMKTDDILIDIRRLLESDKDEEAWKMYPRTYLQYGERIKALVQQKTKTFFNERKDPHIYLFGSPGTGKTSLMKWLYPKTYKKDLQNRFFDLYNDKEHTHIILEDLDMDNVEKLTVQFLKTLCDEAGFPIDQKYKTPQLTRATILITSNYGLDQLINPENTQDVEGTKRALRRRFFHVRVDCLHRLLGVKIIGDFDRKRLKKEGNEDPSKLYMDWDYIQDTPTGRPLKSAEDYQAIIRDFYYS
jgi:hypothetical protein